MFKPNFNHKTERKLIKKRRNEKYDFIHFQETDINFQPEIQTKTRIPCRQQYLRSKNKRNIQKYYSKKTNQNEILNIPNKAFCANSALNDKLNQILKSAESYGNEVNSTFSFPIQLDWSEFEDMDHIQFLSEDNFDLSNVFQILKQHQTLDSDTLDDLCFPYDLESNHSSNLEAELTDDRLENSNISLNRIETFIHDNYSSLFQLDYDVNQWSEILAETNAIFSVCKSNKCLMQEMLIKEYSYSIQEKSVKWTNLSSRCFLIKCCLENIKDSEVVRNNFHITIEIMYDQCIAFLEHGIMKQNNLAARMITGIKKLIVALRDHYQRIESYLSELLTDFERCSTVSLDILDREIHNLDFLLSKNENSINYLESIRHILEKYLECENCRNSLQDPVKQSLHNGLENSTSYFNLMKPSYDIDHSFVEIPFKIIFIFIMSLVCLFGNLELQPEGFLSNDQHESFLQASTIMMSPIQSNNASCRF